MRTFSPLTETKKGAKILGTSLRKKAKMSGAAQRHYCTFTPVLALSPLVAVLMQLNGILMLWKIQQTKRHDAIRAALLKKRNYCLQSANDGVA